MQNNSGCSTFQCCGYRWERTFQKNANLIFRAWLLFSIPGPNISKKLLDAEFNAELFGTNLKLQKSKTEKLICHIYIGEYMAKRLTRQ